jgi:hypothetical protein
MYRGRVGAVAYERGRSTRERPPWGATIWHVFLGYVYAVVFVGLPLLLLSYLGLLPLPARGPEPGPWAPHGAWSIAADVSAFAVVALVTAWFVHGSVAERLRRPVSPLVVLAAVAATSYAPFLRYRLIESGLVALLATAVAIRYLAVDRVHSLRLGRNGLAVAIAAVAAAALTAVSYAVAHPLALAPSGGGTVGIGSDATSFVIGDLRNGGLGDVRILAVDAEVPLSRGWGPSAEPLAGAVIRSRDTISISLPEHACPLDAIVRYELVGRTFEQRLVLDRC